MSNVTPDCRVEPQKVAGHQNDRTDNGNVSPQWTLSGGATTLDSPAGIAVDTTHNLLYIANNSGNSITVFSRTASGNTGPTKTISGGSTTLDGPWGLILDGSLSNIYVTNYASNSVAVFPVTSSGNVAPSQSIVGSATGLNYPTGIALDTDTNELIVNNSSAANNSGTITVYKSSSNGNVAPSRTINAKVGLMGPQGLAMCQ